MSAYTAANLDDIAAEKWPYWAPIRHQFDIHAFGVSAWRGANGDEVIKRHQEGPGGHEELYLVLSGHARFDVGDDEVDAPTGTLVFVRDPEAERVAFATQDGTVILSLGGWPDRKFEVSDWETESLGPSPA